MKRVTLTFDNGPHAQGTPELLRVLADRSLTALFFLVGQNLRDPVLRELAVRTRDAGHRIGNHTLTHGAALGHRPGRETAQLEIGETQRLLSGLADDRLFRPTGDGGRLGPHVLSPDAVDYLERNVYTVVSWNCVPQDWVGPASAWVARADALMQGQEWSVLVLHDHCLVKDMPALERFLDRLLAQGHEFTTEFPAECILIDGGRPMPALEGMYTPVPSAA